MSEDRIPASVDSVSVRMPDIYGRQSARAKPRPQPAAGDRFDPYNTGSRWRPPAAPARTNSERVEDASTISCDPYNTV